MTSCKLALHDQRGYPFMRLQENNNPSLYKLIYPNLEKKSTTLSHDVRFNCFAFLLSFQETIPWTSTPSRWRTTGGSSARWARPRAWHQSGPGTPLSRSSCHRRSRRSSPRESTWRRWRGTRWSCGASPGVASRPVRWVVRIHVKRRTLFYIKKCVFWIDINVLFVEHIEHAWQRSKTVKIILYRPALSLFLSIKIPDFQNSLISWSWGSKIVKGPVGLPF